MKIRYYFAITLAVAAFASQACMTIVVGRKVSTTGRVIVGHNEDDGPPIWIKHGIVPARDWAEGSLLPATAGCNASIPQAVHTFACYWSEVRFPEGDANADSFCNENGVIVVSNSGCLSKERMDDPTLLTEGGVKFNLRRAVGERARTAREAVSIIADLVERYGYAPSARIYTVADKDEAWMVQVVHGKNYVAVRCPDDKVSVMPNVYTVHKLSEFPKDDVLVSPNLLANAREKGFWNGEGEFDFARAYQGYLKNRPDNIFDSYPNSIGRSHQAVRFLTGKDFPARDPLPFAVVPNRRISTAGLRTLLASHNAPLKDGRHDLETWSICTPSTVESAVYEFTEKPTGTVVSVALGHPCEKPYLTFRPFDGGLPLTIDDSSTAVDRLAAHCLPVAELTRETRYLSNDGDDTADGKTPDTAWRSVKRMNDGLPAGGTGYLRSGDTFYGKLEVKGGLDAKCPTVITSYGEGPKPVLTFSKVLKDDPAIWQTGTGTVPLYGIWWCDLTNPANYVGVDDEAVNPGTLLVDGELKPWRKFCWHDINQQWDFSAQGKYLFVYSTNNPAQVSREIQVSLCEGVLALVSNLIVSNVTARMSGSCAMCGGWDDSTVVRHVRIYDCDFENIGGSMLENFEKGEFARKVRFGNGVEFGHNVQDAIVERCRFDGVYDTGFTMQGFPTVSWKDVHVRDCFFTNCSQAYELWCRVAPKGVGFERCSFAGNRCVSVGSGWGAETRPNRCVATPLLLYFMDTDTVDVDVSGNVFSNCPNGLLFSLYGLDDVPAGYKVHDNLVK